MAEQIYKPDLEEAEKTKIKRKGVFDFDELYKMMKRWFEDNGYGEFKEVEYTEKNFAGGKQLEIHWVAYRTISDYIKFKINVDFLVLGLNKIELQRGDQKIKMDKGDLEIRFDSNIVLDPEGRYEKNSLTRFFKPFYKRVVIKKRLDDYEDFIREDLRDLVDYIKKFLGIIRIH